MLWRAVWNEVYGFTLATLALAGCLWYVCEHGNFRTSSPVSYASSRILKQEDTEIAECRFSLREHVQLCNSLLEPQQFIHWLMHIDLRAIKTLEDTVHLAFGTPDHCPQKKAPGLLANDTLLFLATRISKPCRAIPWHFFKVWGSQVQIFTFQDFCPQAIRALNFTVFLKWSRSRLCTQYNQIHIPRQYQTPKKNSQSKQNRKIL